MCVLQLLLLLGSVKVSSVAKGTGDFTNFEAIATSRDLEGIVCRLQMTHLLVLFTKKYNALHLSYKGHHVSKTYYSLKYSHKKRPIQKDSILPT